jgi:hypothetical protein
MVQVWCATKWRLSCGLGADCCCRDGVRTTAVSATPLGQTASQTSCRGTIWTLSAEHTRCAMAWVSALELPLCQGFCAGMQGLRPVLALSRLHTQPSQWVCAGLLTPAGMGPLYNQC